MSTHSTSPLSAHPRPVSSNRQVVVYLSWKAVGEPEWCPTCLHMSRIRVEGTGYTEDGFLGKTIKAHYCEHCAGGEK